MPTSQPVLLRALRWGLLATALLLVICGGIGYLIAGAPGLVGGVLGAGIAGVFFGLTIGSITFGNRFIVGAAVHSRNRVTLTRQLANGNPATNAASHRPANEKTKSMPMLDKLWPNTLWRPSSHSRPKPMTTGGKATGTVTKMSSQPGRLSPNSSAQASHAPATT